MRRSMDRPTNRTFACTTKLDDSCSTALIPVSQREQDTNEQHCRVMLPWHVQQEHAQTFGKLFCFDTLFSEKSDCEAMKRSSTTSVSTEEVHYRTLTTRKPRKTCLHGTYWACDDGCCTFTPNVFRLTWLQNNKHLQSVVLVSSA